MEFSILYWIQGLHRPLLDSFMAAVTFLGEVGWFWILTGTLLFCVKRTRRCGAAVLLSLAVGFLVGNCLLKNVIGRSRPCWIDPSVVLLIASPDDYSFPSGHTLASFESAVSILLCYRRWGIAALVLACLISFSRLYLFVHFPTDVLAGAVLGTGIAVLVHYLLDKRTGPGKDGGTGRTEVKP